MKKKIGDLTIKEIQKFCEIMYSCNLCPLNNIIKHCWDNFANDNENRIDLAQEIEVQENV